MQSDAGKYFQDSNLGAIPTTATTTAITGPTGRLGDGMFFRRMFFGIEGRFMKDWEYEIRFNGGAAGTEQALQLDNIRLGYRGFDHFLIEAGSFDIGWTLEQATSSADGFFLERSSAQTVAVGMAAGAARKAVGVRYFRDVNKTDKTADSVFAMAYVTGDANANPNGVGAAAIVPTLATVAGTSVVTGATFATNPATDGTLTGGVEQSVNILGRIGYRMQPTADTAYTLEGNYAKTISPKAFVSSTLPGTAVKAGLVTFSDRPEFRMDPTALITTGAIPAKSAEIWNIGASGQYQNFMALANYFKYSIERDLIVLPVSTSFTSPEFEGYDATLSWVITGERRGFNKELFGIGGINPTAPFSLKGGSGAFEAVARYSLLDLNYNAGAPGTAAVAGQAWLVNNNSAANGSKAISPTDGRIRGGRQEIETLGVNWYPNSNVKFQVQYEFVNIDRLDAAGHQVGQNLNILATRMQFAF